MKLFILQCKCEILRVLRNRYFVFWSLVMPILFYYIFTNVVNTNAPDKELWQAHYLMSMTVFSVMGSSIMTLGIRKVQENSQGWSKFMRLTPLPDSVYFIAQMVGQSVMHALSIIVIFSAGAIINGVSFSFNVWLLCGLWILLGAIPFLALGTLVGTMKKVETASGVSNLIYMMLAIAGGMWMPLEIMPKMMQNIGKWLPSYNYGDGAWEIIRGNYPDWKNYLILVFFMILFMLLSKYIRRKQEAV
ncbi:ABC transporter permease [Bacillus sp. CGMCC 1.16607]|uniref:ABC transporter permease n=1 Tax=Bacillus sp. CGMCC 1.16607 TaxID=3351842 RepID=UPI00363D3D41